MKIFSGGRRSSHFGFIANASALIAVAAVAVAMLLDRATRGPDAPLVALLAPKPVQPKSGGAQPTLREALLPRFDRVDSTPTASIGRPIVLDPCVGRLK